MRHRRIVPIGLTLVIATTAPIEMTRGANSGPDELAHSRSGSSSLLGSDRARPADRPNIVLILTDDQRFDQLAHLPAIQRELIDRGVRMRRAFVVNSLCCPSRATILTGAYSHTTHIYLNGDGGIGGFPDFDDRSTIATSLQRAGYRTGLFGKYLNHYEQAHYVPPGWTRWRGLVGNNAEYYDYGVSMDGTLVRYHDRPRDYATDVFGTMTATWIRNAPTDRPLFAYYAPPAPHAPFTPPPRYATVSSGTMKRYPSFNERDVSDKPRWIRPNARLTRWQMDAVRRRWTGMHRALLAVDDAVRGIIDALADTGRLRDTMIVFTSDNGMSIGEHRLHYKMNAFEESIRVPMIVRWDGHVPAGRTSRRLVTNMDLAPTFAAAAGTPAPPIAEGVSLLPAWERDRVVRSSFLIEHQFSSRPEDPPTYCAIRTTRWKLVHNVGDENELYDLAEDPWEMHNLIGQLGTSRIRRALMGRLRRLCDPRPPGMPAF